MRMRKLLHSPLAGCMRQCKLRCHNQMVSEGGKICKAYFASFFVSNQYINGYGMQEHDCFYRHAQQHLNSISTLALSLLFDVVCEVKSSMLAAVHAYRLNVQCQHRMIHSKPALSNSAEANPERYANKNQLDLADCLK